MECGGGSVGRGGCRWAMTPVNTTPGGSHMKVDPDGAGLDAKRLERITAHIESRYIEPGKIAGCQVAVTRPGGIGSLRSFGSMALEREKPMADDTIFRIYSMT